MEEQNIGTKKLDKKKKIILTIIAVLILTIGVTLAYIMAQLQDEARGNVNVTSDAVDILRFEVDKDITLNPTQFNVTEGGDNLSDTAVGSAILRANSTNDSATYNYYVYFQINSNDYIYTTEEQTSEIVLTITNPEGNPVTSISGLDYVTSGGVSGFDITTKSGLYEVAELYEIISNSSTQDTIQEWEFTVSFINLDTNQYENGDKTLEAEVILSRESTNYHKVCDSSTLACNVAQLYNEENPESNGIYYHDADLANGALDNSYRYSGANPNNYVCFGSDEVICQSDNLYRIIGIFDGQVKLIKDDFANSNLLGIDGDYSANTYSSTRYPTYSGNFTTINRYYWNNNTFINKWSESNLNTVNLNQNYLNVIASTWSDKIVEHTWQVGGVSAANLFESPVQTVYTYEVGVNTANVTYSAKIGLMYVSDYGFAASPSYWTTTLGNYGGGAQDNNWMYVGLDEWTISRYSDDGAYGIAYFVNNAASVSATFIDNIDNNGNPLGVRPSFYLSSSVVLNGGSGTERDPFRIA